MNRAAFLQPAAVCDNGRHFLRGLDSLFDSDFLKKLEYLALVSRRAHHGQMLAHRTTRQRGSGLEFADHREYVAGDDLRYLDWKVFARHGDLLLKRFHEERDLRVNLLLDASRSMDVGRPSTKFEYALRVSACLAYLALAHLDRVSVTTFARSARVRFPVTRGKHQWLNLLKSLEQLKPSGEDTDLAAAAEALVRPDQAGGQSSGLAVIVSDFLDPRGYQLALDRLRYHGFELFLVHVIDPEEENPAVGPSGAGGDVELVDAETGERIQVTVRRRDLERYREQFNQFRDQLNGYALHHGMGLLSAVTSQPYEELVLQSMRQSGWLTA